MLLRQPVAAPGAPPSICTSTSTRWPSGWNAWQTAGRGLAAAGPRAGGAARAAPPPAPPPARARSRAEHGCALTSAGPRPAGRRSTCRASGRRSPGGLGASRTVRLRALFDDANAHRLPGLFAADRRAAVSAGTFVAPVQARADDLDQAVVPVDDVPLRLGTKPDQETRAAPSRSRRAGFDWALAGMPVCAHYDAGDCTPTAARGSEQLSGEPGAGAVGSGA